MSLTVSATAGPFSLPADIRGFRYTSDNDRVFSPQPLSTSVLRQGSTIFIILGIFNGGNPFDNSISFRYPPETTNGIINIINNSLNPSILVETPRRDVVTLTFPDTCLPNQEDYEIIDNELQILGDKYIYTFTPNPLTVKVQVIRSKKVIIGNKCS